MNRNDLVKIGRTFLLATMLAAIAGFASAGSGDPMTPEVAAKAERTKRQQEERITPAKRKAAAEALKAQRLKLHNARQGAPQALQNNVGDNQDLNAQGSKHE